MKYGFYVVTREVAYIIFFGEGKYGWPNGYHIHLPYVWSRVQIRPQKTALSVDVRKYGRKKFKE